MALGESGALERLSSCRPLGSDRREFVREPVAALAQARDLQAHRPEILELLDVQAARVAAVDEVGQRGAGAFEVARARLDLGALRRLPLAPGRSHTANATGRGRWCHARAS